MSWYLTSDTWASHNEDGTGGVSQEAFGHAPEMEPLALGQIARSDHQQLVMIGFDVFDDGVDHVVHLDLRDDGIAVFDEIVPQGIDQIGCSFHHRFFQLGQLRFR